MASVTYDHVTKKFGNIIALDDLNIHVPDKEFLVLVGPSGCGKSTALRCLAGLEEMTEGRILMDDRVINGVAPKDRDIAMVFQSYALYPHMTVYDNMSYGLRLRKMPKDETDRRVRQAAKNLGMEDLLNRRPKELSGGQRQRVAVGRAIVREPKVFLMDEPLSNLDAKLRVEARAMISRLHQQVETTFIYVTHDQVEAMTMGSRIAVLQGGQLQQLDTPQNLYTRPKNLFVAGFIGSPAMNFFDIKLVGSEEDMYADEGSFKIRLPPEKTRSLAGHLGKDVILGIRPEDIHYRRYVPAGITAAPLTARVDVTELMGSETYVYLMVGQKTFIARVDPRTEAKPGHNLDIVINMDNMHVFDRQTELAIR